MLLAMQLLGIDAKNTNGVQSKQELLIRTHIQRLRSRADLQGVPIVFVPENQTAGFHRHFEEFVERIAGVQTLHEGGKEKPGVCKTAQLTAGYANRTKWALENDNIMVDSRWFTHTDDPTKGGRAGMLDSLKLQLMRFGRDEKGKLTGKYDDFQDDLAIAFMMFIYWAQAVERPGISNPYAHLRHWPTYR